jgi:glutathione synthase/RimK-type ligase-like ATP-grasp enzyme
MPSQFLIVTHGDDLHGLAVQAAVRSRGHDCHIIPCDDLSGAESINFAVGPDEPGDTVLRTVDGRLVRAAEVEAIWWRRFRANQRAIERDHVEGAHASLINNDCAGALVGSLQNSFSGRWISTPRATEYASNKLNQLAAARRCGLRIPDTVITQSPAVVREFCDRHPDGVIVKPVVGTPGPLLYTQTVHEGHLRSEEAIRACPAIYQECIVGTHHIRLNCFGHRSFAGLIESEELDWRPNLNVPVTRWPVPDDLHATVRRVLNMLGLEMGIIDLKLTPEGEPVWLEVNPQGQFLFLEGLTGEPLTEHFVDYFTGCAQGDPCVSRDLLEAATMRPPARIPNRVLRENVVGT